jgi:hypothetical protein
MPAAQIESLEVISGSELGVLDVSALESDRVNVSVVGCPNLAEVRFSGSAAGHIFMYANGHLPEIDIFGGLTYLDLGWHGGQRSLRVVAEPGIRWDGAQIRSAPERFHPVDSDAATFWVLVYPDAIDPTEAPLAEGPETLCLPPPNHLAAQPRDIYVVGAPQIEAIRWVGHSVRSLSVKQFEGLRHFELDAPADLVCISNAPVLERIISAHAIGRLKVEHSSQQAESIAIKAPYQNLQLTNSARALVSEGSPSAPIVLEWCDRLKKVELPAGAPVRCQGCAPDGLALNAVTYYVNENVITVLVSAVQKGDSSAWKKLQRLLPHCGRGPKLKAALEALAKICFTDVPLEEVWESRLMLCLKNRQPHAQLGNSLTASQKETAQGFYNWSMPDDLHRECWVAEWDILEQTYPLWRNTAYAKVLYAGAMEDRACLRALQNRLLLRPRMRETAKQIALSLLETVQDRPLNVRPAEKFSSYIAALAQILLKTIRRSEPRDSAAEKIIRASLLNSLNGANLESFLLEEIALDPVTIRIYIMKRIRVLEKLRTEPDHVKNLHRLLLGGQ